jgi:hypothetical protein
MDKKRYKGFLLFDGKYVGEVDVLGWDKVIHCIDLDNLASQGVAIKLGSPFLRRVTMPVPFENIAAGAWGQTRDQWRTGAPRRQLMGALH